MFTELASGIYRRYVQVSTDVDNTPKSGVY